LGECNTRRVAPPKKPRKWTHTCCFQTIWRNAKVCMLCYTYIVITFLSYQGGGEVPLEDVLSFFSGASKIPPLGFETSPSLSFSDRAVYPMASTCALRLTLPTQYHLSYTKFRMVMNQALTCHGGFGML